MLFSSRKKKQEEQIQEIAAQIGSMHQWMEETQKSGCERSGELDRGLQGLKEQIAELQKMQRRQMQSVEDFLEEEQDRAASEKVLQEKAGKAEEREDRLLALTCCYQEQWQLLRQQVTEGCREDEEKTSAWERQFEIMEEGLKKKMRLCAMEETGEVNEPVDFDCHEVLNVIVTEDRNLDGRVARVFSPGCIYCGKIIKKAQVAAYRRREDGSDHWH